MSLEPNAGPPIAPICRCVNVFRSYAPGMRACACELSPDGMCTPNSIYAYRETRDVQLCTVVSRVWRNDLEFEVWQNGLHERATSTNCSRGMRSVIASRPKGHDVC